MDLQGGEGDGADVASAADLSKWRQAFDAVLHQILAEYEGQEGKIRAAMEKGMRRLFETPYLVEMQDLKKKGSVSFDLEEAQRVLFFPLLSDMSYYVTAFGLRTSEVTSRRLQLMKFKMLSVFYTLHRKDGTLMDRFVHSGGLGGVVELLAEDNAIIKSQALELLIELLSPLMSLQPATSLRQRHLYYQVFLLFRSGPFWKHLAAIITEPAEIFPKSHMNSVRIVAGAIGWLRPMEADSTPEAASIPNGELMESALQAFLDSRVPVPQDIRQLAQDMLLEFRDVPVIRSAPLPSAELSTARAAIFCVDAEKRECAAHALQSLRQLGNAAFGARLFWAAEASYRLALEAGGSYTQAMDASLIESNRAQAMLKVGHNREAASAAKKALDHDPGNAKAAYRYALAMLEHKERCPVEARRQALEAVSAAELASQLSPKDPKVAEALQRARERVLQLRPVADKAQPEEAQHEEAQTEPAAASLDSMD